MARKRNSKATKGSRQKKTGRGKSSRRQSGTRGFAKRQKLTLEEKLTQYLNETLSFENAAVSRLQSRIKEVQLEDAKRQLQQHLEETREQQNRLKQLITSLGASPTKDSGQLPTLIPPRTLANTLKRSMTSAEQQIKSTKEDLVIENAEVTMYDTLLQLAQLMNAGDAVPVLTQNLAEERAMADWIRANTPAMMTQLYPEIQSSIVLPEGEEGRETVTEGLVPTTSAAEGEGESTMDTTTTTGGA
ncbi:MAG: ferritin-like domain-containing protein [Thermoproteota archaeon]|nr:ferritin-like domain-containing protein [Thermoproteota archaeon]